MGSTDINVDGYLSVMFLSLTVYTIGLVLYYAEKGFPWHTYITCILGYICAFGILICVPIDIGAIIQDRKSTDVHDPSYSRDIGKLSDMYIVFYTIIFFLCGIIMCIEEYYNTDGMSVNAHEYTSHTIRIAHRVYCAWV